MRISDWSSDVCSSDLKAGGATATQIAAVQKRRFALRPMVTLPILLSQLLSIILCKTVGKPGRKAQCLCRWFAGLRADGAQQVADAPRRSGKGVRCDRRAHVGYRVVRTGGANETGRQNEPGP